MFTKRVPGPLQYADTFRLLKGSAQSEQLRPTAHFFDVLKAAGQNVPMQKRPELYALENRIIRAGDQKTRETACLALTDEMLRLAPDLNREGILGRTMAWAEGLSFQGESVLAR
ncbi:MAG: hypothetical protein V4735_09045 [Pseudomonadota bacterium]